MKTRTGLALLLVALGAAIACSARTSESTATTTERLKLGDNERISEGAGFTTASVAVHEGGGDFIGGPEDAGPVPLPPPHYEAVIGYQDDRPESQSTPFLNLDMFAIRGQQRSSAEWGVPSEQPSRAAVFSGYAGLPNVVVPEQDAYWDYVGVGATGPEHFRSEVTVARQGEGTWGVHLLTRRLNPAYYPYVSTSGAPNGVAITSIATAYIAESYPSRTWVTWTSPTKCSDDGCIPGVTFLTWYRYERGTGKFEQGPTWKLALPRTGRAVAEYGQAVMIATHNEIAIAWPDAMPDYQWACASTRPVNWHLSEIVPNVDAVGQATQPTITDTVFLSDDDALECLPGVASNPAPARTDFRPTMFYSRNDDSIWVGAAKHIVRYGADYGTRIVMKSTKIGSGSFPISGTLTTCTTRSRVTETDFPIEDAPCHQFAPTSAIARIADHQYQVAMVTWREAGEKSKGRSGIVAATFTPAFPLDFTAFDLSRASDPSTEVPWVQTSPIDVSRMPWGRYDGLGINPKDGRFVAAWADNRNDGAPGTRTEIWSAEVVP